MWQKFVVVQQVGLCTFVKYGQNLKGDYFFKEILSTSLWFFYIDEKIYLAQC